MRYIFITIITILFCFNTFAQTEFAPLGAEWTYRKIVREGSSGSTGHEDLTRTLCDSSYLSDGRTIKVLKSERYGQRFQYNHFAGEFQFYDRDTVSFIDSFYEQNDTVFAYNRLWEQFTPLYVYNVQEGDTVTLPAFSTGFASNIFSNVSECVTQFDSTFSFKIDSIRIINYNGSDLETYFTSPVFTIDWDSSSTHTNTFPFGYIYKTHQLVANWSYFTDRYKVASPIQHSDSYNVHYPIGAYIKRIGGLGGGFFPANEVIHTGQMADVAVHFLNNVNCYSDDELNIPFTNLNCDSFTYNAPLGLNQINALRNMQVYPNPAKDMLHIDLEEPAKGLNIKIVNLLGSIVKSSTPTLQQNNSIDISDLNNGIYLLVIENNGERYYHKFMKQ